MSRKNKRKFDICQVRETIISRHVLVTRDEDKVRITIDRVPKGTPYEEFGTFVGRLACARTEELERTISTEGYDIYSPNEAQRRLRIIASELICQNCVYSGFTPTEVSIKRRELADAEIARIDAFKRLQDARAEISALDNQELTDSPIAHEQHRA